MTTYVLEMRSTANWQDVRYREYTTSAKKAELFKGVPKIQFTDSGHGIVPNVREKARGPREPRNMMLADHVQDYIAAKGREVKPVEPRVPKGMKPIYVKQWRTIVLVSEAYADRIRDALNGPVRNRPAPCPGCDGHECDEGCQYPAAVGSPGDSP